ncbi:amidohydrolase [Acetoanaerobium pronyense]|uniref:Peptidase M20 domain-containing protein 2 n=1 Tax=Acetoanaerobium pronyense TaxID=1482736 RepID=A0ABS4KJM3_9FIRM|nr:M20 family metallopeptidase [Acetoanaerobium pronyense]MBP2027950.1 amidohydrolase [Acetoanaerobium pronyense]
MKDKIIAKLNKIMPELLEINRKLYENPELGYEEFESSKLLIEFLKNQGFNVEEKYLGIETAFRAEYGPEGGMKIGYLCEYDALPEIGHGCGHNSIAAMGVGAATSLKECADDLNLRIVVYGTPAEETSGAKVEMVEKGAFDDLFCAMMCHPTALMAKSGTSSALEAIQFDFHGQTAHAAAEPHMGRNALEGLIHLFNLTFSLRARLKKDANIAGIISEGGLAANIIPEHAQGKFYLRAAKKEYLDFVKEEVVKCAEAAALATGTTFEMKNYEASYQDMRTNEVLSEKFSDNIEYIGLERPHLTRDMTGSIDMGNVSHRVPSIHPWIGFGDESLNPHTRAFAAATLSEKGKNVIYTGSAAMALTGYDVAMDSELREKILKEFKG